VEAYTTQAVLASPSIQMMGSKAEQDYVWAHYEWMQLKADYTEAVAALQEINQLGEHIHDGLLQKKKYLLTVVKAYERMAKMRVCVSARTNIRLHCIIYGIYSHITKAGDRATVKESSFGGRY
jgi:hypothetical protein